MSEEKYAVEKEYKFCFGQYINEDGDICEEGFLGICKYCTECRDSCIKV